MDANFMAEKDGWIIRPAKTEDAASYYKQG